MVHDLSLSYAASVKRPADHVDPDDGRKKPRQASYPASVALEEAGPSVAEALDFLGLSHYEEAFRKCGVVEVDDLRAVEDSHLEAMNLEPLEKLRFRRKIARI